MLILHQRSCAPCGGELIPAMDARDARGVALLLALYAAEGFPFGLVFGSIPFLLKETASFMDVALFSLCATPYALKLLVAPVVDGSHPPIPLGRRPSWIVPAMIGTGVMFMATGPFFDAWVRDARAGLLTLVCFLVITMVAFSEIAVDGWSIEVLSESARPYAALCQVLGPSIGYTSSFTIFLAINDPQLCENFIWPALGLDRKGPLMSLSTAIMVTGFIYLVAATLVVVAVLTNSVRNVYDQDGGDTNLELQPLLPTENNPDTSSVGKHNRNRIGDAYRTFLQVLKLAPVQQLVVILVLCKLGFSSFDAAAPLKLIDYGFPKESIAVIALVQSLCQLLGSIAVTPVVAKGRPELLFVGGFFARYVLSLIGPFAVRYYALQGHLTTGYFIFIIILEAVYGIAAYCFVYVPIAAFFVQITSTSVNIGASYLTLLHAAYNIGTMWPKPVTLSLVDLCTFYHQCADAVCPVWIDGFYVVSVLEAIVGAFVGLYIWRKMPLLGKISPDSWAIQLSSSPG